MILRERMTQCLRIDIRPVEDHDDRQGAAGDAHDSRAETGGGAVVIAEAGFNGGYCTWSGNSIPEYVKYENYMAMLDEVPRSDDRG
jgi:hypothetical protein